MTPPTQDILRLKACPLCDYDLAGLPDEHACPECGFEYDPSMARLEVWPLDDEPKIGALLFLGFLTALMALLTYSMLRASGPVAWWRLWPLPALVIFGGVFAILCRRTWLHLKGRTETTLVMGSMGCMLVSKGEPGPWNMWSALPDRPLKRLRHGRWRLTVQRGLVLRLLDPTATFVFTADRRTAAAIRRHVRRLAGGMERS